MRIEARLPRAAAVRVLAPSGERHQSDPLAPRLRADAPRDLIAVEQRHADIEQRHFGQVPLGGLEREAPVGGAEDFVATQLQDRRQSLQRVDVVVRDQYAATHRRRLFGCGGRPAVRGLRRLEQQRQPDHEFAPQAGALAVRADGPAVHLQQPAHQGEPDPETAVRVMRVAVELGEQVEDPGQHLRGNADAVVAHPDFDLRPLAADAETDAPSPLGVFGRVAQDVAQGLREPQRVGVDPERRIGNLGRELVPALLYQGLHDLDGARDQRRKLDRLARQVDLAARDARHIEQVVDQSREVRELPLDHVARPAQLWVGYRLHAHELYGTQNRRQRIAQLVREHREELVLVAVRLLQRLFRPGPLGNFALQRAVRAFELRIGALQGGIEGFELAGLLRLQRRVGLGQALVRQLEIAVQLAQLAALAVQLDQHGDLAAQDLRHHRYGHVVDRPDLVALEAVELGHVHAGDEDDGSLLEARMVVDQPCRLETVHFRHADIEQHHGEFLAHELVQRLEPRVSAYQVLPQLAQHRLVGEQPRRLVIDQQDVDFLTDLHAATAPRSHHS